MTTEKIRYIPHNYQPLHVDPDLGVEVHGAEVNGKWYAIAYSGKRTKSDWHYSFKTKEKLDTAIAELVNGLKQSRELKARLKAERLQPHDVKIGEVFKCSWGYDQTNVDFFQVVGVTGSMVEVRPIAQMSEETGFMSGECAPQIGQYIGDSMRKKVSMSGGSPSIRIHSFANAYRMKPVAMVGDKPVFDTSYFSYYA
jgi:hypothetical protein